MRDSISGNVIIFNGEIYNHLAVRRALNLPEEAWRGHSDTETILVGYRVWGEAVLDRLKGMFAFAIFDTSKQSLWLVRDRLGIKPLFISLVGRNVYFASELRGLPALPDAVISRAAVAQFLSWGACPEENLLPEGRRALGAGAWVEFSAQGSRRVGQYWPAKRIVAPPAIDAPRRVRELLSKAVEEHLLSDVPVACFLSGGIDSSILAALAAAKLGGKLQTYTVGFPQPEFDESRIAEAVARRHGTNHQLIRVTEENCLAWVHEALAAMDLPSIDAINTYIVAKAVAGQGIKVTLSGLGADELFGGYPSFRDVPRLMWLARLPRAFRAQMRNLPGAFKRLAELPGPDVTALAHWRRQFFTNDELAALGVPRTEPRFPACPGGMDNFGRVSWAELTGYMRHMLLRDSDNMSMAVSLELRVPFLDHELVEYVLTLPQAEKRGYRWPKGLLITACRDLLPPEVYERKKMGFSLPMDTWMRGPLASLCREGIEKLLANGFLDAGAVGAMGERFAARRLHWTRWWSFVVLGHYVGRTQNASRTAASA